MHRKSKTPPVPGETALIKVDQEKKPTEFDLSDEPGHESGHESVFPEGFIFNGEYSLKSVKHLPQRSDSSFDTDYVRLGVIYISSKEGTYLVRDMQGKIQTGSLIENGVSLDELRVNMTPARMKRILEITAKAGHTFPELDVETLISNIDLRLNEVCLQSTELGYQELKALSSDGTFSFVRAPWYAFKLLSELKDNDPANAEQMTVYVNVAGSTYLACHTPGVISEGQFAEPIPDLVEKLQDTTSQYLILEMLGRAGQVFTAREKVNIPHYLNYFYENTGFPPIVYVVMFHHLMSYHRRQRQPLHDLTIHNLLVTALLLACKVYADAPWRNVDFSKTTNIPLKKLKRMERVMLGALDYQVMPSPEVLYKTTKLLLGSSKMANPTMRNWASFLYYDPTGQLVAKPGKVPFKESAVAEAKLPADSSLWTAFQEAQSRILKNPNDHYKVLGVPKTASKADIQAAYRKLSVLLHPDKNRESKDQEQMASDLFKIVVTAHEEALGALTKKPKPRPKSFTP